MQEYKSSPSFIKAITGRQVVGYAAVMGNIDSGNDRLWPGAFSKTISENRKRVRHLWMHEGDEPPIAVIDDLREVGRDQLPPEMIGSNPQAVGALEVTRTYLAFDDADAVFQGVQAGAINEMSFGFDPIKIDFETIEGIGQVRNLREVKLYDTSDVNWGMNAATIASKSDISVEIIARKIAKLSAQLKAGRVLSAANMQLVQNAIEALQALLTAAEPQTDAQTSVGKSNPSQAALTVIRYRHAQRERELTFN